MEKHVDGLWKSNFLLASGFVIDVWQMPVECAFFRKVFGFKKGWNYRQLPLEVEIKNVHNIIVTSYL